MPHLKLDVRHQPTGLNSRFAGEYPAFSEYVAASIGMLLKAHAGRPPQEIERIVEGNAPFEFFPPAEAASGAGRKVRGVLLVHGLTDSPYFMRPLGEHFRQQGFRVMAVLLPGHGTRPGDLLESAWQEWASAVAYGVRQLSAEADEVYLAGFSAGAALAVRHALLHGGVRGLFLFSPALGISSLARWANMHKLLSWMIPARKWLDIRPDDDWYKYESFPKHAAWQMYDLARDLNMRLAHSPLEIPVFAAASADDATVDVAATLSFMARVKNGSSKLVYYTTRPGAILPGIPPDRVEQVNSILPEQHILGYSHLSLLIPPGDAHYGRAGDYSNCLHYYPQDPSYYAACKQNGPGVLQGEVTPDNLRAGLMRRLTYNPHFDGLMAAMQTFIQSQS